MFATMKQIFHRENKDLQKRILFTLGVLFIYKLGTSIIVPGIDKNALGTNSLGFLELMNVMGGGSMERFSIFSLGVLPYINASIIMQLLQMDIVPYLADLAKEGHTGRQKLNMITRVVGIVLAFIQGYMLSFVYIQGGTVIEYMGFATVLTAGTAFLLWLGDQVTAKGVGNGISLIIMAGIVSNLPTMFYTAWEGFTGNAMSAMGILKFVLFAFIYFGIIIGVVYEQLTERRVPIQYANKSAGVMTGKQNYIPFKLNSAGVMPVIFASALLSIPSLIAQVSKNTKAISFVNNWITYTSPTGFVLYLVLILAFAYFYTFLEIKPKDMAEDLQKSGGYIPGVRPGDETKKYITRVLKNLTIVGALLLAFIAGLPIVFGMFSGLPSSVTIGGTGLIIVVGVALETYKQIESGLVTRNYKRGRRY